MCSSDLVLDATSPLRETIRAGRIMQVADRIDGHFDRHISQGHSGCVVHEEVVYLIAGGERQAIMNLQQLKGGTRLRACLLAIGAAWGLGVPVATIQSAAASLVARAGSGDR